MAKTEGSSDFFDESNLITWSGKSLTRTPDVFLPLSSQIYPPKCCYAPAAGALVCTQRTRILRTRFSGKRAAPKSQSSRDSIFSRPRYFRIRIDEQTTSSSPQICLVRFENNFSHQNHFFPPKTSYSSLDMHLAYPLPYSQGLSGSPVSFLRTRNKVESGFETFV
jgi:hypothetical protein